MDSQRRPTVLLAQDGDWTRAIYHALRGRFGEPQVLLEDAVSGVALLRARLRRVGPIAPLGQALFATAVMPLLERRGAHRIAAIEAEHELDVSPIPRFERIGSVNSEAARAALRRRRPGVVVLSGTRILERKTLSCVDATFLNMHAGITPHYRGVHGGWWALAEGRTDLVGTTIHVVDEGVDTGAPVAQCFFSVGVEDSFATYPYLHLAAGIPALLDAVAAVRAGTLQTNEAPALPSRLRMHPTLWRYLAARLTRGVR